MCRDCSTRRSSEDLAKTVLSIGREGHMWLEHHTSLRVLSTSKRTHTGHLLRKSVTTWELGVFKAVVYSFIVLEWNRVRYHCGNLLACCTSPGWQMVMVVEQLVEWMSSRGNRSTRRKPAPAPVWPPHISHDFTRFRTRTDAVGSLHLAAGATARPIKMANIRTEVIRVVIQCQ
jgi:hypothetical protein